MYRRKVDSIFQQIHKLFRVFNLWQNCFIRFDNKAYSTLQDGSYSCASKNGVNDKFFLDEYFYHLLKTLILVTSLIQNVFDNPDKSINYAYKALELSKMVKNSDNPDLIRVRSKVYIMLAN